MITRRVFMALGLSVAISIPVAATFIVLGRSDTKENVSNRSKNTPADNLYNEIFSEDGFEDKQVAPVLEVETPELKQLVAPRMIQVSIPELLPQVPPLEQMIVPPIHSNVAPPRAIVFVDPSATQNHYAVAQATPIAFPDPIPEEVIFSRLHHNGLAADIKDEIITPAKLTRARES